MEYAVHVRDKAHRAIKMLLQIWKRVLCQRFAIYQFVIE